MVKLDQNKLKIREDTIEYIEDNQKLIQNRDYITLYSNAIYSADTKELPYWDRDNVGQISSILYLSGIEVLDYFSYVPPFFFYEQPVQGEVKLIGIVEDICRYSFADTLITTIDLSTHQVEHIEKYAFYRTNLNKVILGETTQTIGENAFGGCRDLKEIVYKGTKSQWQNKIKKSPYWCDNTYTKTVKCIDGTISIKEVT